jgi:hypothetical protein
LKTCCYKSLAGGEALRTRAGKDQND